MNKNICKTVLSLFPYYSDKELDEPLVKEIDEHLENCPKCRENYEILSELVKKCKVDNEQPSETMKNFFKDNLNAFIDNELSKEDYEKFNVYTVNNPVAMMELEKMFDLKFQISDEVERNSSLKPVDFASNIIDKIKKENGDYYPELLANFLTSTLIFFVCGASFILVAHAVNII